MAVDTDGTAFLAAKAARLMAKATPQPTFVAPASKPVTIRSPPGASSTTPSGGARDIAQDENTLWRASEPPPAVTITKPTAAPSSSPPPPPPSAPTPRSPLVSRDLNVEESTARGPSGWGDADALREAREFLSNSTGGRVRSHPGGSRGTSRSSASSSSADPRSNGITPSPVHHAAPTSRAPPAPFRSNPSVPPATKRLSPAAPSNAWSSFAANPTPKAGEPKDKKTLDTSSFDFKPPTASTAREASTTAATTAMKPPAAPAATSTATSIGRGTPPHLRMKQIATEFKVSTSEQQKINAQLKDLGLLERKEKDTVVFDVKNRLAELDRQPKVHPAAARHRDTAPVTAEAQDAVLTAPKSASLAPVANHATPLEVLEARTEERVQNIAKPPAAHASAIPATSAPAAPSIRSVVAPMPASQGLSAIADATASVDTQNLLSTITSLQKELQALQAKVSYLEDELHDANARLHVVSIAEEKRRGVGTEGAKKYFFIKTIYPNRNVRQIPVTGETKVRDVIRRAALEGGLKLKQDMKPTLAFAGEQYGHSQTMIECGIQEGSQVQVHYIGQEVEQHEQSEEEEL